MVEMNNKIVAEENKQQLFAPTGQMVQCSDIQCIEVELHRNVIFITWSLFSSR